MRNRKIGAILVIILLCSIPTMVMGKTLESDNVKMRIYGGLGIHFEVDNNEPNDKTVTYTISTELLTSDGELIVNSGSTKKHTVYPMGVFEPITAALCMKGKHITKTGYIIGIFVIFTQIK